MNAQVRAENPPYPSSRRQDAYTREGGIDFSENSTVVAPHVSWSRLMDMMDFPPDLRVWGCATGGSWWDWNADLVPELH